MVAYSEERPLVIIGGAGQLARAFAQARPEAILLNRGAIDLLYPDKIAEALEAYAPACVINAAAYTQVDNAESEERIAHIVNEQSPTAMAIYCARAEIPFVHFSSDYVFDGSGNIPWREDDAPSPINAYGRSKLAGENAIAHIGGQHMIFRTSWLHDATGKNFVNSILRLARERDELRVIDDQHGAPTYAPHLANAIVNILEAAEEQSELPSGIYHLCSGGVTTWFGFAAAILEEAVRNGLPLKAHHITPIPAREYPLPAARPLNSRLDCSKVRSMFGVSLAHWRQGLAASMELRRENF